MKLVGAVYDLETGRVRFLEQAEARVAAWRGLACAAFRGRVENSRSNGTVVDVTPSYRTFPEQG